MGTVEVSVGTLGLVAGVGAALAVASYLLYIMAGEEGKEITPGLKMSFPVPDLPDLPDLFPGLRLPERV